MAASVRVSQIRLRSAGSFEGSRLWSWLYSSKSCSSRASLVVGVGPGHRREQVVDDDSVRAPLGLCALARDR